MAIDDLYDAIEDLKREHTHEISLLDEKIDALEDRIYWLSEALKSAMEYAEAVDHTDRDYDVLIRECESALAHG